MVGSAARLIKGVSVCLCHRGGQGRGGLCGARWGGGERIYAGVADTGEPHIRRSLATDSSQVGDCKQAPAPRHAVESLGK